MIKISNWISCIIVVCGLLVPGASAGSLQVTDMAERQVTVPDDPERIICLGPGTLRLIVYLQAESKVVGVEAMEKRPWRASLLDCPS